VDNFKVEEISADLAYSSRTNIALANSLNVNPFIPFKRNATARADGCMGWTKRTIILEPQGRVLEAVSSA